MIKYELMNKYVLAQALSKWGVDSQCKMLTEECAELIVAQNHYDRGRVGVEALAEEMADVLIMIAEIAQGITGTSLVNQFLEDKMQRLENRIAGRADNEDSSISTEGNR